MAKIVSFSQYGGPEVLQYEDIDVETPGNRLQKAAVDFILDGLSKGTLKTIIAQRFKFDDMIEAHRVLEKNQHIGRLVVNV